MPSQPLARLNATSSDRPIMLLYDAKSGHAGGQLFKKIVKDSTDELTFVAWQLGGEVAHDSKLTRAMVGKPEIIRGSRVIIGTENSAYRKRIRADASHVLWTTPR